MDSTEPQSSDDLINLYVSNIRADKELADKEYQELSAHVEPLFPNTHNISNRSLLPFELHELICSHLDTISLKQYSLACQLFHLIAQRRIFLKVVLLYPPEDRRTSPFQRRTENLLRLSQSCPQIYDIVQVVVLTHALRDRSFFTTSRRWDDRHLSLLLSRLTNVKKFAIESVSIDFDWQEIPTTLEEALDNTLRSNTLVKLALYNVKYLPFDVLNGCVALEELSLERVSFQMIETDCFLPGSWKPIAQCEQKAQLKSLRLALSPSQFPYFSTWIISSVCNLGITELQRLAVSMIAEHDDHGDLNKILQACAKTLQIFCFSPIPHSRTQLVATTSIDFSILSSLRILRLRLGVVIRVFNGEYTEKDRYVETRESYYPWIFHLLSQLSSSHPISEISLKANLLTEHEISDMDLEGIVAMWRPLDTFLASLATSSLRRFRIFAFHIDGWEAMEARITQLFPKLKEAEILSLEKAHALRGYFRGNKTLDFLERVEVH